MDSLPLPDLLPSGAKHIDVAHISSNIEELLNPHIKTATERGHQIVVKVVGGDVPNLVQENYNGWRVLLSQWLSTGVDVEYLALGCPEHLESTKRVCSALLASCEDRKGKLALFTPALESQEDEDVRGLLQDLIHEHLESHFLLAIDLHDPAGSQMWVENEHKPGDTNANDCYYYRPCVAAKSPEFVQNRLNFEFLKGASEEVVVTPA